jgi:hypothetical protein
MLFKNSPSILNAPQFPHSIRDWSRWCETRSTRASELQNGHALLVMRQPSNLSPEEWICRLIMAAEMPFTPTGRKVGVSLYDLSPSMRGVSSSVSDPFEQSNGKETTGRCQRVSLSAADTEGCRGKGDRGSISWLTRARNRYQMVLLRPPTTHTGGATMPCKQTTQTGKPHKTSLAVPVETWKALRIAAIENEEQV